MRDDSNHISLITKIRAMEGKLLTDLDFNNMHNMNSMIDIFSYLDEKEDYKAIFDAYDNMVELHRNQLEHLLIHVLYENIIKIYKFATGEERQFLDIIVSRLEVDMLKKSIANLKNNYADKHVIAYASFFKKHSDIDFDKIYKANDIQQFATLLKGTKYYKLINDSLINECNKLSDYETALDINYFLNIWNNKKKFNADIERIITHLVGTEIDLYNISSIFRCKKFYNMQPYQIKNYVVPVGYKIKKKQLEDMIQADDIAAFLSEFNKSYYKKVGITFELKNMDASFERTLNELHLNFLKKNPNSLTRVYTYIDKKNYEIHYITRIIENIRYK